MPTRITLAEAAEILDLSQSTVRRLADAGKLGPVRRTPGGFRRLSREGVERYQNREEAAHLPFDIGAPR